MKIAGLFSGCGTNIVSAVMEQRMINDIISARAHEIWEQRVLNKVPGDAGQDWKQAKREYNLKLFYSIGD